MGSGRASVSRRARGAESSRGLLALRRERGLLARGHAYELRLELVDPDGAREERVLATRTRAEPVAVARRVLHVAPGSGGGAGTIDDPLLGLAAADAVAQPGDLFIVKGGGHASARLTRSGTATDPIVWRGDGATISSVAVGIDLRGTHDVWVENFTIEDVDTGVLADQCEGVVVRGCAIRTRVFGVVADQGNNSGFFIADNVIEGPMVWPRARGADGRYLSANILAWNMGVRLNGVGHVVCHNRIARFRDGIDLVPGVRVSAIDIHENDLFEMVDDGIELDGSERNVRCFENRLTNVFQGISSQPVFGGPVYVFRNAIYNCEVEPFRNSFSRNNVFVGTSGVAAFDDTGRTRRGPWFRRTVPGDADQTSRVSPMVTRL